MDENQNNMATLLGYEEVELQKAIGGKKSVKVKCLPVRALAEYAALFTLEPELVELCSDLTAEEVDMLLPADSGAIFKKAHDLNFVPFTEWLQRKGEAAKMQARAYGVALPETANPTATAGETPASL